VQSSSSRKKWYYLNKNLNSIAIGEHSTANTNKHAETVSKN